MPELIEQMYCSQQIVIPPKFPYILKRYAKAAIKTQPYDLLRWSFEYFKALAEHRTPPVKLRLEYPVFSTEGGLTRGYLKVLAHQLDGMTEVQLSMVQSLWRGACLDYDELRRIFCLCEVYMRSETVPKLHFLAVAGGMLTKSLTNTMILLCETLTAEPDGGSAAVPVDDFLAMYSFLARMDASRDVKYYDGYKEGETPNTESSSVEEEEPAPGVESIPSETSDDFWQDTIEFQKLTVINDNFARSTRLSVRLTLPPIGKIERSPSVERASKIERETFMRERKGRAEIDEETELKMKQMSVSQLPQAEREAGQKAQEEKKPAQEQIDRIQIVITDEDGHFLPLQFYGEPQELSGEELGEEMYPKEEFGEEHLKEEEIEFTEKNKIAQYVAECYQIRQNRFEEIERVIEELAEIADRFASANYDLGMVAGRQMSTTSGEFIVQHVEKDIMAYVDEQIAVLPDPDLKKKKAKPEEVAMIKDILRQFLDDNMDAIVPEEEEVEEEEAPVPEVTVVFAVPGIGPPVDEDILKEFIDYALDITKCQADTFMPRNIRHFLCPPLEKYIEQEYEILEKEPQVPTGGVLTD